MITPRPAPLVLTDGERSRLAAWADDPSAGPLAVRARIVLACAAGAPDLPAARPLSRVAAELGLSRDTVRKWRSRFLAMRLAGLRDAPRPGAPRTITDDQVAGVIARLLLEPPPGGRRRWSTRLMAAETGMSQSAVSRIWRQAGLSDPGRLDLTRIGDNDRMNSMQAGFPPHRAAPAQPVPGEAPEQRAPGEAPEQRAPGEAPEQRAPGEAPGRPVAAEWVPGQRVSAEGLAGEQAGFAGVAAPPRGESREGMRAQEDISAVRPAGPAEGADEQRADLPPGRYFDREESWLRFNQRVLELAEDESLPLLERARFLSIFASNLDEFFMVRIAGRMRWMATGLPVESMTGRPPEEVLSRTLGLARELSARHAEDYARSVQPALAEEGIEVLRWKELSADEQADLQRLFRERIYPVLTPLVVDPAHPFPYISGLSLSLAVMV